MERTGPGQAGVAADETTAGIKRISAGENTTCRSKNERKRKDETLAMAGVEEDWRGMIAPDPAFYLKDNGKRK